MRFSCGETDEMRKARLEQWHPFFALWPRYISTEVGVVGIWLETIERKGIYWEGNYAGGEGWTWEYR